MIVPRKTVTDTPTTNLHEWSRSAETSTRKILAFTAAVFVVSTISVVSLLLYLGQGMFASLLAGLFVGLTAAIEIGWFGGAALFGDPGER